MSNCDNPIRLLAYSCMNNVAVICILYPFIMYLHSSPSLAVADSRCRAVAAQTRHCKYVQLSRLSGISVEGIFWDCLVQHPGRLPSSHP